MDQGTASVTHAQSAHRFELTVGGRVVGVADYRDAGGRRHFVHTQIDPAYGGRGLATALVAQALAQTRDAGLRIVPECSFVAHFVRRHPEVLDVRPPVGGTSGRPPGTAHR